MKVFTLPLGSQCRRQAASGPHTCTAAWSGSSAGAVSTGRQTADRFTHAARTLSGCTHLLQLRTGGAADQVKHVIRQLCISNRVIDGFRHPYRPAERTADSSGRQGGGANSPSPGPGQREVIVSQEQCLHQHSLYDIAGLVLVGSAMEGGARVEHLIQVQHLLQFR